MKKVGLHGLSLPVDRKERERFWLSFFFFQIGIYKLSIQDKGSAAPPKSRRSQVF